VSASWDNLVKACVKDTPLKKNLAHKTLAHTGHNGLSSSHVQCLAVEASNQETEIAETPWSQTKHGEGEIFDDKAEEYTVSDQRKADQAAVDSQLMVAVKAADKYMEGFLATKFTLQTGDYPHKMKF